MLGRRAAGRLDRRQPLLATVRRVREELALPDELVAASTDANAALAAGIPALCLGCAQGGEMHTPEEYIEIGSLAAGREQLRRSVALLAARLARSIRSHDRPGPPARSARRRGDRARGRLRARRARARRRRALRQRRAARARQGRARALARGGAQPAREAALVVLAGGRTYEAIVALESDALASWEHVEGVHAAITGDEYAESEVAVKADAGFRRALALRGVHDLDLVMVDTWSVGLFEGQGERVGRALAWLRSDLTGRQRLRAADRRPDRARRPEHHAGRPHRRPRRAARPAGARRLPQRRRAPVPPTTCARSRSPSRRARAWCSTAGALRWGPWSVRVGFNPREALTLHELAFDEGDGGGPRPIAHRLSIAELAIPYADTNPTVVFKNAFDIGEYGIGPYTNSLELGCDCLGEIRYLDAVMHDSRGTPQVIRNAICLHEEDAGHPLEALRLAQRRDGRAPRAPARDLDDRDRRQLRVRVLLVPRRSTAPSPSRPSSRACSTPPGVARRGVALGDARGARRERRLSTSTSSARGSTSTWTASATRSRRSRRSPIRPALPTRTGSRSACARRRSRASSPPSG